MDMDRLSSLLKNEDIILLDGWEEDLFALDKYGRKACKIDTSINADESDTISRIRQALREPTQSIPSPGLVFELHVVIESIAIDEIVCSIERLLRAITSRTRVRCYIHFPHDLSELNGVTEFTRKVRSINSPNRLEIVLSGPFGECSASLLEVLFKQQVELEFVAGWWKGCSQHDYIDLRSPIIEKIAAFGYRVPVLWYVHQQNVDHMEALVQSSLRANYESGVVLLR